MTITLTEGATIAMMKHLSAAYSNNLQTLLLLVLLLAHIAKTLPLVPAVVLMLLMLSCYNPTILKTILYRVSGL
jgi:hypothetical protein